MHVRYDGTSFVTSRHLGDMSMNSDARMSLFSFAMAIVGKCSMSSEEQGCISGPPTMRCAYDRRRILCMLGRWSNERILSLSDSSFIYIARI